MIFIVYTHCMPNRDTEDKWEPIDSLGETGRVVARNIRTLRKARNLAYTELSARLRELKREIPTWGLRKIESGGRRVDTDDLVALAFALNVSPLALLLPTTPSAVLPGGKKYAAEQIWKWGTGEYPLLGTEDVLAFIRDSRPLDRADVEAFVVEHLSGASPSVQGAIASSASRDKARRARRQTVADEVARGDD